MILDPFSLFLFLMSELILKKLIVLGFSTLLLSCDKTDQTYCDKIYEIASKNAVQNFLVEWVDLNFVNETEIEKFVRPASGVWPGQYRLDKDFEWNAIDFSENSQIQLVTLPGENVFKNTVSIAFSERSRVAILVLVDEDSEYGVLDEYLKFISPRVAVVCNI